MAFPVASRRSSMFPEGNGLLRLPFAVCRLPSLDNLLLGIGDEDRRMKAWIWVCSSQLYGLQRMNKIVSCHNYVVVLVVFFL